MTRPLAMYLPRYHYRHLFSRGSLTRRRGYSFLHLLTTGSSLSPNRCALANIGRPIYLVHSNTTLHSLWRAFSIKFVQECCFLHSNRWDQKRAALSEAKLVQRTYLSIYNVNCSLSLVCIHRVLEKDGITNLHLSLRSGRTPGSRGGCSPRARARCRRSRRTLHDPRASARPALLCPTPCPRKRNGGCPDDAKKQYLIRGLSQEDGEIFGPLKTRKRGEDLSSWKDFKC